MARLECSTTSTYDVVRAPHVFDLTNPALSEAVHCARGLVVFDSGVNASHAVALREYLAARLPGFSLLAMHLSEEAKTVDTVLEICAVAQKQRLGRRDVLVAVGGGVCCDLVSVAASLIRRGLPYITVPTTLLAQVDAGVGLKGAVNFGGHKNYLGCFRPPARVLIDPSFLDSVPLAEVTSGAAEILKMALVRDFALVQQLRQYGRELVSSGFASPSGLGADVIDRSVELMLEELGANPYEEYGLRRLVDFGHTFSTRLEELCGWQVRHGEAVAVDMALSSAMAAELGLLTEMDLREILTLISDLGLPLYSSLIDETVVFEAVEAATGHRGGALNLVVPTGLGSATFVERPTDLPPDAVAASLSRVRTFTTARGFAPLHAMR